MPGSTNTAVPTWHEYADADALAVGLADALACVCSDAIGARSMAWIALAGGRTPLPAYARLTRAPGIDWGRVVAVATDERCVPFDHPACNTRALMAQFVDSPGLSVLPLTRPSDGEPDASELLAQRELNSRAQPFDAVVLGMGGDAHTASLFPGAPQLAGALDPRNTLEAIRVDPMPLPPEAPFPRITLTASRLLRAHEIHVALTGADKRGVLERALASNDVTAHPIAIVGRAAPDTRVHLHWSP
ncbi:6-phosphogluconolactonase [Cognatilysobacter bugurensis]|uniref:6-phosphogluconolactonase n=1 Tax=Cognatilysobacter bugurensis TaxID=543356 RepID=A0A918T1F6_9GAMM|nr:6-phosphogluconolactonase [Lysobacter bugurensis]GHA81820.1 6-phosphogluconolactonase [Lysobacter bugurensis]